MNTELELSPIVVTLSRSKDFLDPEDVEGWSYHPLTGEVHVPEDGDQSELPKDFVLYPLKDRNHAYQKDLRTDLARWKGEVSTVPEMRAEAEYNAAIALAKERGESCDAIPLDLEDDANRRITYTSLDVPNEERPSLREVESLQLLLDLTQATNQFRRFGLFKKGSSARVNLRACTIRQHWTGRLEELARLAQDLSLAAARMTADRSRALALALHRLRAFRSRAANDVFIMKREFRQTLFSPTWTVEDAAAAYGLARRDFDSFHEPFEEIREEFWERVQDHQNRHEIELEAARVRDESKFHAERHNELAQIFATLSAAETDSFQTQFELLKRHFLEIESSCLSPLVADMGEKELKLLQRDISQNADIKAEHELVRQTRNECIDIITNSKEFVSTTSALSAVLVSCTLRSACEMAAALQTRLATRFNLITQNEVSAQFSLAFDSMDAMIGVLVQNENKRLNDMVDVMHKVIKFRGKEATVLSVLGPQPISPFAGEVLWAFGKALQSRYFSGTIATSTFEEELMRSWVPGNISATQVKRLVTAICPNQSANLDWREFIHAAAVSAGYVPRVPTLKELIEIRRAMHAATRGRVPDRLSWDLFSSLSYWFDEVEQIDSPDAVTGEELRRFYFELWSDDGGESIEYPILLRHWAADFDPLGGAGIVPGKKSTLQRAVGMHRAMLLMGYPIAAKYVPDQIQTTQAQLEAILTRHKLRGLKSDVSSLPYFRPNIIVAKSDRATITADGTTFNACCESAVNAGTDAWITSPTYRMCNIFQIMTE